MRLYNRDLEQIQNENREKRIQGIVEKNISLLVNKYQIDENLLRKRLENLSVVEKEGKTHFVIYNGKKVEINSGNPASFVTKKEQEFDGDKWNFENAVYTSDNNSDHTITHELFHFLSANTGMDFNVNGIGYDKMGVSIDGYDKDDKEIDDGMKAKGLNEGITEMLAMEVDRKNTPDVYMSQVYMASILANSQGKDLIKAYFSENPMYFKQFLEDFDKRQSVISSKELVSLSTVSSNVINVELLKGCLEYSLSFCKNVEQLKIERTRLLPIFKNMSKMNEYSISFSDDKFDVSKYFEDTMLSKKQKIQDNQTEKEQQSENSNNKDEKSDKSAKMKFIDGFINAYNDTETEYLYNKRAEFSLEDLTRFKNIIESNGMNRMLLVDLEPKWIETTDSNKNFKEQYSQKQVSAMARLLKVAQLLTDSKKLNPEGKNYLEEFTNLPDIEYKLKQMKSDFKDENSYMYQMRAEARENRKNGTIPSYPLTLAEIEAKDTPPTTLRNEQKQQIGMSLAQQEKLKKEQEEKLRQEIEEKAKQEKKERERTETERKTGQKGKEKFENIKTMVENGKVTESERQEELQETKGLMEMKKLSFRAKTGQHLTEEEKRLFEENERRINQTQVAYRKSMDSKDEHERGLSM